MNPSKCLILESHPVQYRAPVYRCLETLRPGCFEVVFGTDATAGKAYQDRDFGVSVTWDTPLLQGYASHSLSHDDASCLNRFTGLKGRGLWRLLNELRPRGLVLCQFLYAMDFVALTWARTHGVPVWMRQETQDLAYTRPWWKDQIRTLCYRAIYSQLQGALPIGQRNRDHLVRHGIDPRHLIPAPYCVSDPARSMSGQEKSRRREECRQRFGWEPSRRVIAFFGKLIPKKQPDMLIRALDRLGEDAKARVSLLYVGSGHLKAELRALTGQRGVDARFCGFINQSEIIDYYLASDVVMLPSRRMGETWGLVMNEALQAGCAVAMSEAVGSSVEFGNWERAATFPVEDVDAAARALEPLLRFERDFDWACAPMEHYSIEAAAQGYARLWDGYFAR